jgi:hypothetical protein
MERLGTVLLIAPVSGVIYRSTQLECLNNDDSELTLINSLSRLMLPYQRLIVN